MTETLGWGDVDVEAPRRRRVSARLLWLVAIVVVAVIVLVPPARGHFASSAAGWLQQQWATAQAYDDSRTEIEAVVVQRLGIGDQRALVQVVQALDREEASRLAAIARAIGSHRSWSGDVARTMRAARQAVAAEAHDLLRDSQQAAPSIEALGYPPLAISDTTQDQLRAAGALVAAAARRHHADATRHPSARLTSADRISAALQRVTDEPVDAAIVLASGGSGQVWDLRTGRQVREVGGPDDMGLAAIGGALMVDTGRGRVLVSSNGTRSAPLPETPNGYLPAGGSGLWDMTGEGTAQRYDLSGRRVGPAYPLPPRSLPGSFTATADAIVVEVEDFTVGRSTAVAWFPGTGREVPIVGSCDDSFSAGEHAIAFFNCFRQQIEVLDLRTRRASWIAVPRRFSVVSSPTISPDGTRVAVELSPPDVPADDTSALRLAVGDVSSGRLTQLPRAAYPLQWSADSSLLLANAPDGATSSGVAPLAYWRPGMQDLAAIRLPVASFDAAFLLQAG